MGRVGREKKKEKEVLEEDEEPKKMEKEVRL